MKRSNLWFESILAAITFITGAISLSTHDEILFLMWWAALGFLQVIHSFSIAILYWEHRKIRQCILLYWGGVALDLMLIFTGITKSEHIQDLTLAILPVVLALFLWGITYVFRAKDPAPERI